MSAGGNCREWGEIFDHRKKEFLITSLLTTFLRFVTFYI
jgi:hypothetical protein